MPDKYSQQLDRLLKHAESGCYRGVSFWCDNGESRAIWGWGLDPNARCLDGHWYLLCTPDDGRGLTPAMEMQCAISDLDDIAAEEKACHNTLFHGSPQQT